MKLEEMFSEILWSFEVLKVSGHVLRGIEILTFGHVRVVFQDNYLVDLEDG